MLGKIDYKSICASTILITIGGLAGLVFATITDMSYFLLVEGDSLDTELSTEASVLAELWMIGCAAIGAALGLVTGLTCSDIAVAISTLRSSEGSEEEALPLYSSESLSS